MRLSALTFFLISSLTYFSLQADAVQAEEAVRFDVIEQISIQELWGMLPPEIISSDSSAIVGYWKFGSDNIERDGDLYLIGIVTGGFWGLGDKPIGAKVWVQEDVVLLMEKSKSTSANSDSATAFFGLPEYACADERVLRCTQPPNSFVVFPNGEVYAGGVKIGSIF